MRVSILAPTLLLTTFLYSGCGDDPTAQARVANFSGDWILVATLAEKMPCHSSDLDETVIQELSIAQDGNSARLDFEDYSVTGEVLDGVLRASGNAPDGKSLQLELMRQAQTLDGTARVFEDDCNEERSVVAVRRTADRDFSGHWEFQLRVVGEGGCPTIVDYSDCFRILQTGSELLVVDDMAGNLAGRVFGNIAEIERDTEAEATWLIFYLGDDGNSLTGNALRSFSAQGCRTDLSFVGGRSTVPCAQHGP